MVPHFVNVLMGPWILEHTVCLLLGHSNLLSSLFPAERVGFMDRAPILLSGWCSPSGLLSPKGRTYKKYAWWMAHGIRVWRSGCKRWEPMAERGFWAMNVRHDMNTRLLLVLDSGTEQRLLSLCLTWIHRIRRNRGPGTIRVWEPRGWVLLPSWKIIQMPTS